MLTLFTDFVSVRPKGVLGTAPIVLALGVAKAAFRQDSDGLDRRCFSGGREAGMVSYLPRLAQMSPLVSRV
jgi:hypothetical protein